MWRRTPKGFENAMEIRRWGVGVGVATALLVAMSCGGEPEAPPGPDFVGNAVPVILVVVDTLRADHLSLYGYERPTSPTLDVWARQGRVFDNALAPSPWTLPSFGSLYTGRWPLIHQAGIAEGLHPSGQTLPLGPTAGVPTLAETLRAVGYRTIAVANNPFLAPTFGMARGFDIYDFDSGASNGQHRPAEEVVQRAFDLVDDVDGQPFFLVMHLFEPHLEYNAPPPFRDSFSASIHSELTLPIEDLSGLRNRSHDIAPQDRAFVAAAYDEEIAYVDEQLGVLRDGLANRGLLDRSIIVLTSDHGEELFDHGGFEHGHAMWQELLHVPLVIWAPGVEPGRESAPVSLTDIAPTVLDNLGIAPPTPFDGISLWPNLSAVEPLPQRPLFAEGVLYGATQTAVVNWPHKIIVNHQDGLIDGYDLARDPRERSSRAGNASAPLPPLIADLCHHQRLAQEVGPSLDQQPAEPDRDVLERLRSLGYLRVNIGADQRLRDRQFPCYADVGWGADIHVRWDEAMGDAQRKELERSLGLERAEHREDTTWKYRVLDASPEHLNAIATHEMVEDTHGFDRATLELDRPAGR